VALATPAPVAISMRGCSRSRQRPYGACAGIVIASCGSCWSRACGSCRRPRHRALHGRGRAGAGPVVTTAIKPVCVIAVAVASRVPAGWPALPGASQFDGDEADSSMTLALADPLQHFDAW